MTQNKTDLSRMTSRKPWHGGMRRRRMATGVSVACAIGAAGIVLFANASAPEHEQANENFVDIETIHDDLASLTHDPRWTEPGQTGALCHALFDVAARAREASSSVKTKAMTGWYTDTVDRAAVAGAFIAASSGTSLPYDEPMNPALTDDKRWAIAGQRGPLCRVLFETRGVMPDMEKPRPTTFWESGLIVYN